MKKVYLLSLFLLSACGNTYNFYMKSLIDSGNNNTICIASLDKKIETTQYKMFFKDWLSLNGFKVVDKKCKYLFGFGSKLDSFSFNQTVADYGVTGIRSIDTYTNSNTYGSINGQSQYWGRGYSTFNGYGSYNTQSHSTTNINYDYGITGYHQETKTQYFTRFNSFIMDIKSQDVIFSSGVSLDKVQSEDEFIKRVFSIYTQNRIQNIDNISYFCDDEGCAEKSGWDIWREKY